MDMASVVPPLHSSPVAVVPTVVEPGIGASLQPVLRARPLTPTVRETAARPAESPIMWLSGTEIRAPITRNPQADEMITAEQDRKEWYPGRPDGGSLTMLAAIIGSLVDDTSIGSPGWMLERAAECMHVNEEEMVIRIGR